ncbi:MAG: lysophospholipid acyltransferase family protein [Ignavibacteria bacterium]|nr:lysophospholipid acyltransferase family protein [Ignavibacteria bacterium]
MKRLRFYLETCFVYLIGWFSSLFSPSKRLTFGKILGRILYFLLPQRVKIARQNLLFAYPTKDPKWVNDITKKVFENLGIVFAEFLALPWFDENVIKDYIRFENVELIREKYNEGKGVLLLSGHYGNWELLAYSVKVYLGLSVLIIVKPLSNYILDRVINQFRTQGGNQVVSMYESALKVVRTLKEKGIVALLADQSATKDKDIYVNFFGRKAATFDSPAHFALKYKVPVIIGFAKRESYYYKVRLEEIDHSDLNFDKEGIYELTRRYIEKLENVINEKPELWLWTHRRWKHNQENS